MHTNRPERAARTGFSLLEVLLAMTILGMLATCLTAGVIQSRKIAEANVYESTALTVATGYLEQIRSIQYGVLVDAITAGTGSELPTLKDQGADDPIYLSQKTDKPILIDREVDDDGNVLRELWMPFRIQPELRNMDPINGLDAIEITLHFEWRNPYTRNFRTRTIKSVRSHVPTF